MTHAKRRWSYSTGERGRNRVRAYEHQTTGLLFLEFSDRGTRTRIALGHRDREVAKTKAEELAIALRHAEQPAEMVTLQTLFDIYIVEVTPQKGASKQQHDRRAAERFLEFFGAERNPATLNRRDWDAYIRWRTETGDERPGRARGRPVRPRAVEYDLRFLQAVLNWATTARNHAGDVLLERNPLKGMPWPREVSPRRPTLTEEEYQALLAVSRDVDPRFELALVLAHETGHRMSAIRRLRWVDLDFGRQLVRWRAENDKIAFDHVTPLTEVALVQLQRAQREQATIGEGWVFPAPKDPTAPCSRHQLRTWWRRAEVKAKVRRVHGRGWHSLRRQFATELKTVPLRDLCQLGGWKSPLTVLTCYQQPDEATMRQALARRGRVESTPRIDTTAVSHT